MRTFTRARTIDKLLARDASVTLLVSLYGPDYVILLSDRRLTSNGRLFDDESNKATVAIFEDARLAIGFTGLAQSGTFRTEDWLLDALSDAGPPDYLSVPTLQRLRQAATATFVGHPALARLATPDKRLAVLFAGFHHAPEGAYRVGAILTNFAGFAGPGDLPAEPDQFVLREIRMDVETRVGFAGAWHAVTAVEVEALNGMLFKGKPANAVLNKALEVMHAAGDRDRGNTIGGQISSVIIPANNRVGVTTGYHVRRCNTISYMPNLAVLTKANVLLAKGGQIAPSDQAGNPSPDAVPIAVPKVHRNAPCPCGSKVRYRKCHGRPTKR